MKQKSILALAISTIVVALNPTAQATVYYWDVNGAGTTGFGTITGAWNTGSFWNTSSTGAAGTVGSEFFSVKTLKWIGAG